MTTLKYSILSTPRGLVNEFCNPVENFELFENFVENFYSNILKEESTSFPILFCEPPLHNKDFRLKITEIFMEKLQVPGFFMSKSSVLTSYSCAKSTCLVVDSGHNCTYVSVVQDGYVNQKSNGINE
jgi:actin-related protein